MARKSTRWSRRQVLSGMAAMAAGAAGATLLGSRRMRPALASTPSLGTQNTSADPYFLIVLCASGGASILDGALAIRESECANASTRNCFPDAAVSDIADSPFRAVSMAFDTVGNLPMPFTSDQSSFVSKYHRDMMIATVNNTSVNHAVAQRRSVTGNEAWNGRTLQEAVAQAHGGGYTLPNVHLITGTGFTERGGDGTLDSGSYGEMVPDASVWPLSLDSLRGTKHPLSHELVARARSMRDDVMEPQSAFQRAFGRSPQLQRWRAMRGETVPAIEEADLITKLMFPPDSAEFPLNAHGLESSPSGQRVRDAFPNYRTDPLHMQAALAFLLLKYRVSVTVTLGPGFDLALNGDFDLNPGNGLPPGSVANPPLAFDLAHQEHRSAQAWMWDRIYATMGGLIELLKGEEFGEGQSMWDRTLIYVATDFGRSKNRPANALAFSSGHDLNNAAVVVSPLARGNTLLGGVDRDSGLTYGFDLSSGAPDPGRLTSEAELYAGILQALKVDTSGSGLPDVPAMRRA